MQGNSPRLVLPRSGTCCSICCYAIRTAPMVVPVADLKPSTKVLM